jgi:hypothetical protein
MEIFPRLLCCRQGEFVIESESAPDNGKPFEHYRCHRDFVELIGWVRSKGVVSRTPLHALRREFGSQINARFGLVAAQRMLRHAQVAVTAAHYAEIKARPSWASDICSKVTAPSSPIDSQHEKTTDNTARAAPAR